jgi:hypothetical protein
MALNYKYSLMGLAAGTALLLAGGCSKQESPAAPAADNSPKASSVVSGDNAPAVQAPKAVDSRPAVSPTPAPAAAAVPVAVTTAPATNPVAVQSPKAAADQPTATTPVASAIITNEPQRLALAQSATNQFKALAAARTDQLLAALGTTNQVLALGTNQVEVLLQRAKTLSANQKYQEALDTVTQLYSTKLTPDQKQKADDLKAQIQTSLTQEATAKASSALGNFLGGKK